MSSALAPILVLSVPFLYVLARKPVLRRLALRNARRRPREAMLVIAGSLLGTAIMTTSRGIMTTNQARKLGIGGEVIAEIW